MKLPDALWFISDWLYPRARPLSKAEAERIKENQADESAECKKRVAALPDDKDVLSGYLGECTKALEAEDVRGQSVQGRLTSVVGLSSIAATIVFGSILVQATGTLHVQKAWLRWLMALGALYLALQLCCAIIAAIGGLERRSYLSMKTQDIFPFQTGEGRSACLRRRIEECLRLLPDRRSHVNDMVTQMAIAHRALRNFLWALLLLAMAGTLTALTSASSGNQPNGRLGNSRPLQVLPGSSQKLGRTRIGPSPNQQQASHPVSKNKD